MAEVDSGPSSQRAIINNERLGSYYQRVAKRRDHRKAIVAAREILTTIYHILSKK